MGTPLMKNLNDNYYFKHFVIILDRQERCKKKTEIFCVLFNQFALMLTSYISLEYISKVRKCPWHNTVI